MFLASESWQSENSKKCYFYSFRTIFTCIPQPHDKFEFLHQRLNPKHNTCRAVLRLKTVDFVRCMNSDNPKVPRKPLKINFPDIQTHPHLSTITTGFISFIKISFKSYLVVETFVIGRLSILYLALEYWQSNIPNNAIYNVSFPYWNS